MSTLCPPTYCYGITERDASLNSDQRWTEVLATGLRLPTGSAGGGLGVDEAARRRFETYFPRVFAYAQHFTADENATRELVTQAFTRAFSRAARFREEDDFRLALFRAARDLVGKVPAPAAQEGLTARERHLVSLLFDGLLSHKEVATLLHMREERVTLELMRALKKLRSGIDPKGAPSFLRAF